MTHCPYCHCRGCSPDCPGPAAIDICPDCGGSKDAALDVCGGCNEAAYYRRNDIP